MILMLLGAAQAASAPEPHFGPVCGPVSVPQLAQLIPDSVTWRAQGQEKTVSFVPACRAHDTCYHAPYSGDRATARGRCDDAFLADLNAACATLPRTWVGERAACLVQAEGYQEAVVRFGDPAFVAVKKQN